MKILITILLALFLSSHAYAQSHGEVLEKGRILQKHEVKYGEAFYIVAYNNWLYSCLYDGSTSPWKVNCYLVKGSNDEVENVR